MDHFQSGPPQSPPCPICGEGFEGREYFLASIEPYQFVHSGPCIEEWERRKAESTKLKNL